MVLVLALATWLIFRSFRRWQQPRPGQTASQQQSEMQLLSEARITDRL